MNTITLSTPERHALREAAEMQLRRWQDFAAMMRREGKAEPDNAKQARQNTAAALARLDIA